MRFEQLVLERYGAFERLTLPLAGAGLTVVHGPNEAGKSTCLQALGDFLFGIPERTAMGGLFGYDGMRIGATLSLADGRRLELRRRRGRGNTLTDTAGAPADPGLLAGLLGATDRARFARLFGLHHESLRAGGEQLLAADGEIGRLIVEAGGGLTSLIERLDAIDAEADTLFAPRKASTRAFYPALDAFNDAEARYRAASLSRETWEAARRGREKAQAALEALRAERLALAVERGRLDRLVRVAPLLAQLDAVEASLEESVALAALPEDFAAAWPEAKRRRDAAAQALAAETAAHDELRARIEGLPTDPDALALASDILTLEARAGRIADARLDRPNREVELAENRARLAPLRERLGLAPDASLAARLPPAAAVEAAQRLALEAIEREPRRAQAARTLADRTDDLARLNAAIAQKRAEGLERDWGVAAADIAGLPARRARLEAEAAEAETEAAALAAEIAALIGGGDQEALRRLPLPSPEALRGEAEAREALAAEHARQTALAAEAQGKARAAEREIARQRAGGEIATDAAVADARAARDAAWSPIRAAWLAAAPPADAATRQAWAEGVDAGLAQADTLADRRAREAQRVATLAEAERRRDEALAAAADAIALGERLAADLAAREATFARAFPQACALQAAPRALQALAGARDTLLARVAASERRHADLAARRAELSPSLSALAAVEALAGLDPGADLAARCRLAAAALAARDAARAALARSIEAADAAEAEVARRTRDLSGIEAEVAAAGPAWAEAMAALGAAADAGPVEVSGLAAQWAEARGLLDALALTERRLSRMDEDAAALAAGCAAVCAALDIPPPPDAVAGARDLGDRLARARKADAQYQALAPELAALQARLAAADRAADAATAALEALAERAGAAGLDGAARDDLARRHGARRLDLETQAGLLASLRTAGDGLGAALLREQGAGRDVDALRGEQAAAEARLVALDAELEAAVRAEKTAADALAAFETGGDAVTAAADREAATARMHAVLERWVSLKIARGLVEKAIAKVRAERQDPLLRRAGALFAAATRGAYAGVRADIDSHGAPVVVGARANGALVPVAMMSDGARDQLFLAFRLASLEGYARAAEPLPFVADDILVHFDDARGAATLDLLATVAAASATQVLLFTHHDAVRDAAARLEREGRASVVRLGD